MSEYGIEIFNSLGNLVFSSSKKTVQILKHGTLLLYDGGSLTKHVEFDPVPERPQIYAQISGFYYIRAINYQQGSWPYYEYEVYYETLIPAISRFAKNEQGLYYRVSLTSASIFYERKGVYSYRHSDPGGTWDGYVPYVIFV